MSYEAGIIAVVSTILGLGGVALSVESAASFRQVVGARSPDDAESGAVVRAEGRVEPASDPLYAPLTGDRCAGYVLAQQLYYRWGTLPFRRWQTHRVWHTVPAFDVVDRLSVRVRVGRESGSAVRTGDRTPPDSVFGDLHLERTASSQRFGSDEPPPDVVSTAVDGSLEADHPHRYVEWCLDDDAVVTVVGELAKVDPPTITDRGSVFVLSTGSMWPAMVALAARSAAYLTFGLGTLVIAAVIVAGTLL